MHSLNAYVALFQFILGIILSPAGYLLQVRKNLQRHLFISVLCRIRSEMSMFLMCLITLVMVSYVSADFKHAPSKLLYVFAQVLLVVKIQF